MDRVLGTLVYARQYFSSGSAGRVLMLHRNKEPNKGLWVAPGGKVELYESPLECAVRELREETGLIARHMALRGLVTEVSPREDYQWLLFIYVTDDFTGELIPCNEGSLAWVDVGAVPLLPIPQADAIFFPHIINGDEPLYQARYIYDANLNLVHVEEFTWQGENNPV
ncbi:MAG: 8-oxo-dGTP diphosphatase [Anaerolineae bacterium]